jgi:hypothetical protein
MNLRTGDLLLWRSTSFYDTLSDIGFQLKGLHSGVVLVGDKFSKLSMCGKSPSNTYMSFLIDKIFPIEEIVGHVWIRANGAALYHIHRTEGPDVNEGYALSIIEELFTMKKLSIYHSIYISLAAYFKWGDIAPSTSYNNRKWQVCSLFNEYLLDRFGLLSNDAIINNLLPIDFYNLEFYQRYNYENTTIFDKGTYTLDYWFNAFFITSGSITPEPIHHPVIENIMGNYNYPRFDRRKHSSTQQLFTEL